MRHCGMPSPLPADGSHAFFISLQTAGKSSARARDANPSRGFILGWGSTPRARIILFSCGSGLNPGKKALWDFRRVQSRFWKRCWAGPCTRVSQARPKSAPGLCLRRAGLCRAPAVSCSDLSLCLSAASKFCQRCFYTFWEQGTAWEVLNRAIISFPVDLGKEKKKKETKGRLKRIFANSLPVSLISEFQFYCDVIIWRNSNRTSQPAKLRIPEFWH